MKGDQEEDDIIQAIESIVGAERTGDCNFFYCPECAETIRGGTKDGIDHATLHQNPS